MIFDKRELQKLLICNGVGFCELLFLLFLGLRLGGGIDWHPVWVFAPIWLPVGCYLLYIFVEFVRAFIEVYKEKNNEKK